MKLAGKNVWLTGASSGIGAACVRELVSKGANVIISARREPQLGKVRDGSGDPSRVAVVPLDVTASETFADAADEARSKFGTIDLLIHCAGVTQRSLAHETELEAERRIMEINFFGVIGLTKQVLPDMLARGSGHIAVISSLAAYVATKRRSTYSASKHALHGYFESMRAELHDQGIRIHLLCPGFVHTSLSANAITADGSAHGVDESGHQNGISAEQCAREIVEGIVDEKREKLIGGREVGYVYLRRFLPGLVAFGARRSSR